MRFASSLLNLKSSVESHYSWWLVGVGVVILTLAGDGFILSFFGIWWSDPRGSTELMTWVTTSGLRANLVLAIVAAMAVDRFGPRPALLAGLALCAAVGIAAALMPVSVVTFALVPILAIGMSLATHAPILHTVNDWFDRLKPLAIAILLAAVEVLNFFTALATTSPRTATLIFGVLILVVGLPLATWVRRRTPGPDQMVESGLPGAEETGQQDDGPAAPEYRVVGGLMGLRMRLRSALLIFAIAHVVAVIMAIVAPSTWWLFVAVIILGASQGGRRALEIAAIGHYFGRTKFATLLASKGLLVGISSLAIGVGPLFISNLADNPTWAFALATIPATVGVVAYRMLGDPKPAPTKVTAADSAI